MANPLLPAGYPSGITPTLQDYIQPIDPVNPATQYTPMPVPQAPNPVDSLYDNLLVPPTHVPQSPDMSLKATLGRAWDGISGAVSDTWNQHAPNLLAEGTPTTEFVNDVVDNAQNFVTNPVGQTTDAFMAADQMGLIGQNNTPKEIVVTPEEAEANQASSTNAQTTIKSDGDPARLAAETSGTVEETNWFKTVDDTFDLKTIGMNLLANSDSGMSTLGNLGKSAIASQENMQRQRQLDARNQAMIDVANINASGRTGAAQAQAMTLAKMMEAQRDQQEEGMTESQSRLYTSQLAGVLGVKPSDEAEMAELNNTSPALFGLGQEIYGQRPTATQMAELISIVGPQIKDTSFWFPDAIDSDKLNSFISSADKSAVIQAIQARRQGVQ